MADAVQDRVSTDVKGKGVTLRGYLEAYARQPVEVVNGEFVVMSPPAFKHARIAHRLYDSIRDFLKGNPTGDVFIETAYLLDADDRTDWVRGSRQPDVSFSSREQITAHLDQYGEEGPLRFAPDLAVEIVSPTDAYVDVSQKIADYLRSGVRLVWVIDPQARTVRVLSPEDPDGHTLHEPGTLPGDPVLPGWSMTLEALFGQARAETPTDS